MTAEEVIRVIDEFIGKVDAGCDELASGHPDRERLEYLHVLVGKAKLRLKDRPPKPENPAFQNAARELKAASEQFIGPVTLDVETGEKISRFMNAVTQLTGIGGAKAAPPLAGTDEPEVP